jgi:hypothetical protein
MLASPVSALQMWNLTDVLNQNLHFNQNSWGSLRRIEVGEMLVKGLQKWSCFCLWIGSSFQKAQPPPPSVTIPISSFCGSEGHLELAVTFSRFI